MLFRSRMDGTDHSGLGDSSLVFFLDGTVQEYQLGLRFRKATADLDSARCLFGPAHGRLSHLRLLADSFGVSSDYAQLKRDASHGLGFALLIPSWRNHSAQACVQVEQG